MGGDEFVLLLPQIARDKHVDKIVTRVLETFQEPFSLDGVRFHITASIGLAVCPEHGHDAETLIKNADIAMYRAKKNGGNRCKRFCSAIHSEFLKSLARWEDTQEVGTESSPSSQLRSSTSKITKPNDS